MKRKEFVDLWIEYLESGKYKQAREALRKGKKNPRFCCLGVACLVSNDAKFVRQIDVFDDDDHKQALPPRLARRLNVTTMGRFKELVEYKGRSYITLVGLNDDAKNFAPYDGSHRFMITS